MGRAHRLPFDRVCVGKGPQQILIDVDHFMRLPLKTRVRHILRRDISFFRGDDLVDTGTALRALMGRASPRS